MALPPQVFQFHDIAAVEIWSDAPFARAFFDAEYGYHRMDRPQDGLPHAFLDFRLVPRFFAGLDFAPPEGFTYHVHKLLARWGYRLTIRPGDIDIRVYGNRTAVSMVHHMLVHPSLRWLAAGSGTPGEPSGPPAREFPTCAPDFTAPSGKGAAGPKLPVPGPAVEAAGV